MKNIVKLASLAIALVVSSSAIAASGSVNGGFKTQAAISSSCLLSSSNVAFGAFTPTATATKLSANGIISATCSNGVVYNLSLNAGLKGTIATRMMGGGAVQNADKLAYNIFTNAAGTIIFGDNTSGSKITVTGNGTLQATTIYGSLLTNQYITPDNYADTLIISMAY